MSAPTIDHTLDEILNLAAAHFKVPREKLTPDDDFFKTLGIDSLQALDLLTRLEHHFRIELPDLNCKAYRISARWRIESMRGCRPAYRYVLINSCFSRCLGVSVVR